MRTIIFLLILQLGALAEDTVLAQALVKAAAAQLAAGRPQMAEDALYRALVYDEQCGAAWLALAKLREKIGDKLEAAALYQRAARALTDRSAVTYAESRACALNPCYEKIQAAFKEYAYNLEANFKAHPDAITLDACSERMNALRLTTTLRPESAPKLYPDGVVNLMPLLRVDSALPDGWMKSGTGISSPAWGICKLEIPYVPPETYEFSVEFKRLDDMGVVGITVPIKGVWQQLWHEYNHANLYGKPDIKAPLAFKAGDTRMLSLKVSGTHVEASMNGRVIHSIDKPVQAPEWVPKNKLTLGINVKNCRAEILSVTIKETSGRGYVLEK